MGQTIVNQKRGSATTEEPLTGLSLPLLSSPVSDEKQPEGKPKLSREEAIQQLKLFPDDSEKVKEALLSAPSAFNLASSRLRGNFDFIREIAKTGISDDFLEHISSELKEDRNLALEVVKSRARGLYYFPKLQEDQELCRLVVARNPALYGPVLKIISDKARANPEIALLAISGWPSVIRDVPDKLLNDPAFMKEAFKANPELLQQLKSDLPDFYRKVVADREYLGEIVSYVDPSALPAEALELPDIAEQVVRIDGLSINLIPEKLRTRELALAAVRQNGEALRYVPQFSNDRELLLAAVASNPAAVRFMDKDALGDSAFIRQLVTTCVQSYPEIKARLAGHKEEKELTAAAREARDIMKEAFRLLEVEFPLTSIGVVNKNANRFDSSREFIRNRYLMELPYIKEKLTQILGQDYFTGVEKDTRPLCLVCFPEPTTDDNLALRQDSGVDRAGFSRVRDNIDKLTHGYRVVYYQTRFDVEFFSALFRIREPAMMLVLAGHGEQTSLRLGNSSSEAVNLLTLEDQEKLRERRAKLAEGSSIVLLSCSTGKNLDAGSGVDNVAEMFSSAFPQAKVFAPYKDTNATFRLSPDGKFYSPGYWGHAGIVIPPNRGVSE